MAQTPIKQFVISGTQIFVEDEAGMIEPIFIAFDEERARWVLDALTRFHKKPVVTEKVEAEKPIKVVTICGSTRFKDDIQRARERETLNGHMVLGPDVFLHEESEDIPPGWTIRVDREMLEELHLAKINVCDEVLVVNPNGYIGESTARQIMHARDIGRPVRYEVAPRM